MGGGRPNAPSEGNPKRTYPKTTPLKDVDAAGADELLRRVRRGKTLWILHANADPDCVGSTSALVQGFGGVASAPEGLSRDGRLLAERLGLALDPWPHPEQFDAVVAVDTSSRAQLGRLGGLVAAPLLVDHHAYGDLQGVAPAKAWDPARASCAEVVLALLARAGVTPAPDAAFGLLVGLATDTARFRFADPAALRAAAQLVEASGATIESVYEFLDRAQEETPDDLSARKATLTAASRARIEQWGGWLVASSEIGAHDGTAAGLLVRAGADFAIVAMERPTSARLSLRASARAREAGLNLGLVANEAARAVGWSGGGHEGAAGLQGKPPLAPARDEAMRLARAALKEG